MTNRSRPSPSRRRLTEVLVAMGAVDQALLERAAAEFYDRKYGEWLVEQGIITDEVLTLALARQAAESGDFDGASKQLTSVRAKLHGRTLRHIDGISSMISRLGALGRSS